MGVEELRERNLFWVRRLKDKSIRVQEVPKRTSNMSHDDVFILDAVEKIYVWEGEKASPFEKAKANTFAENLESERAGKAQVTHDIDDGFWAVVTGGQDAIQAALTDETKAAVNNEPELYQLTDEGGSMKVNLIAEGAGITKSQLNSNDVMMLDAKSEIFLWVGKGASTSEGRSCWRLAFEYLAANNRPKTIPIHCYREGHNISNKDWQRIMK